MLFYVMNVENRTEKLEDELERLQYVMYEWKNRIAVFTTGKICVAVQHFFAVCPRTAKKSLPCAQIKTHGKDLGHGKDRHKRTAKIRFTAKMEEAARQRKVHGNGPTHRTAKTWCTAKALGIAVPHPLPCAQLGCTAKQPLPSVFEKTHGKEAFA
jgi:hypothetical protein